MQHQQEWELRKILDDKAKNIISVSGIVTALVFGFATFMTRDSINIPLQSLEHLKNSLTISIIFIILSIFFSAFSLKLQTYVLPFSHANFYDKNKKGFDQNKIDAAVDASVIVFRNTLIDKYLEANNLNNKESRFKAIMVTVSQWLFFVGIFMITVSLVLLIILI
jgi:hypothetical protein